MEDDDNSLSQLEEETSHKLVISEPNRKGSMSSLASGSAHSAAPSSMQSVRSSLSAVSPPTSPLKSFASTANEAAPSGKTESRLTNSGDMPVRLQPLFNYILWRIHQELNPAAALETFIFLCNDPSKTIAAKGFDIRSKRLEQLRDVVGREDREYRNRLSLLSKEGQQQAATTPAVKTTKEPKSPPTERSHGSRCLQPLCAACGQASNCSSLESARSLRPAGSWWCHARNCTWKSSRKRRLTQRSCARSRWRLCFSQQSSRWCLCCTDGWSD
jgi:hypothetical protein